MPGTVDPQPASEKLSMDGRVVVITGGARGIGRATAFEMVKLGARVGLIDRLEDELAHTVAALETMGGRVVSSVGDVRADGAADQFMTRVRSELGGVDVLVNNAGGGFFAAFDTISSGGRRALIDENFTQVAEWSRVASAMLPAGGSIVNITSIEGHRAGPGFSVYSAMKAAVENLTKTLSLELAHKAIRVNAIAPDMIPTPGDKGLSEASAALSDDRYAAQPLTRAGRPQDVAHAVAFLASELAAFVTGTTLHVDGGNSAASGWRRSVEDGHYSL